MMVCLNLRKAIAIASVTLAAFALNIPARAVTDTAFDYSKPKNGHFTIHGMGFTPADTVAADNYSIDLAGIHSSFATGGICFHAAADFPNDAKLTGMTLWYK